MKNYHLKNNLDNNKIGEGNFGSVYRISINSMDYALKLEKFPQSMKNEIEILRDLKHPQIPEILGTGNIKDLVYIIIPLFKFSILHIFMIDQDFFDLNNKCIISYNLLNILKYIHSKGYVYRDIKPENFMIGINNTINLIDFSVCSKYLVDNIHIEKEYTELFVGTPKYASINTHCGYIQSRRDDIESLFYFILFLNFKSLPWSVFEDN